MAGAGGAPRGRPRGGAPARDPPRPPLLRVTGRLRGPRPRPETIAARVFLPAAAGEVFRAHGRRRAGRRPLELRRREPRRVSEVRPGDAARPGAVRPRRRHPRRDRSRAKTVRDASGQPRRLRLAGDTGRRPRRTRRFSRAPPGELRRLPRRHLDRRAVALALAALAGHEPEAARPAGRGGRRRAGLARGAGAARGGRGFHPAGDRLAGVRPRRLLALHAGIRPATPWGPTGRCPASTGRPRRR